MRRLFDSQEILSTLGRRLDRYVEAGRLEAASEQQLWSLVFRMADNAVIDKARVFRRLERSEREDGPVAQELSRRLHSAERRRPDGFEIEIERAVASLPDPVDRQILYFWLADMPQSEIAEFVDLAPTAVRKRWQKIRGILRERLVAEVA